MDINDASIGVQHESSKSIVSSSPQYIDLEMTTFLVGGCMRSGTSLVQAVLCSTDETNPQIHEAQYFTQLVHLYGYARRTFDRFLCHYFRNLDELSAYHADLMFGFLDQTLRRYSPAKHLVLKNPEMTPLFPEICNLLTDVKFIFVVRDPRDTIVSMLDVAQRQEEQGSDTNLTRMVGSVEQLAARYNWYYAALTGAPNDIFDSRRIVIRYEDIIKNTDSVVEELAAFTGLPLRGFDANAGWRTLVDFNDADLIKEPFHSVLRGKPLSASRIGRYADQLTRDDIAIVEHECAHMMKAYGYEFSGQQ